MENSIVYIRARQLQEGARARTGMSKIAFTASFLACFITMDVHFFHGETTRTVWSGLNLTAQAAQSQITRWVRFH